MDGKIRLYTSLQNSSVKEINEQNWKVEFPGEITTFHKSILNK